MKEYRTNGEDSFTYKKRGIKEGERTKIPLEEIKKLSVLLTSCTPDELGLNYTLWNSKVVRKYIFDQPLSTEVESLEVWTRSPVLC